MAELVVLFGAAVCAWLAWQLIQFLGTPVQHAKATVVRKRYTAGSVRTQGVGAGMHTTSTPSTHVVTLELPDGRRGEIDVSAAQYKQLAEGDQRGVLYQESRFSDGVRIARVMLTEEDR